PESKLDMVVAGTADAVLMVESEASELSEEVMLGAVMFAHKGFQPVIDAIIDLAEKCAKEPWAVAAPSADYAALEHKLHELAEAPLREAYLETQKQLRVEKITAAKAGALAVVEAEGLDKNAAAGILKHVEKDIVRGNILKTGQRID